MESRPHIMSDEKELKLAEVHAELEECNERYLRTLAEFDNYRKRVEREQSEIGTAGKRDLLLALLEIADNLERAIGAAPDAGEPEQRGLQAGVLAIYRQVRRLLETHGVEAFESVRQQFDPERHDAVGTVKDPDVPPGFVANEVRQGYLWNGKLLRAARVVVAEEAHS